MTAGAPLQVRVRDIVELAPSLKRFSFEPAHGGLFPTPPAGGHVMLTLRDGARVMKNAYSLVSPPMERARYDIIVRLVAQSRGGSDFLHRKVAPGDVLEMARPVSLFPLASSAKKHLLIGGGIGITPLLSFLPEMKARGARFELHQLATGEEVPVFERLLAPYATGEEIRVHGGGRAAFDLAGLLSRQPLGTHVYVCGPHALMDAVTGTAAALGWPRGKIHKESFGGATGGLPFRAVLRRSGIEVEVGETQTLLEAIEAAGVAAPCLCRGGACGECVTPVIEGEVDHRDDFLSAEEKAGGKVVMTCVSRARGPRLVLDL
ncbi:UNVERIFIED_ORG: ferredoxin-NADP reductase [Xanthobacter viscosus]|jgi:ferredoxin-NADP reductase|uniref:Oxidoreductase n=1 Tax=Xanthobacter autotrophicus TaxID=280 RepID=A0A6C1KFE5_XANAU|nr:PDR/VanB family oxidoreductase [Xanthobacter autotrophicus]TLX42481.1 oxidoreductase [Xanthobacter autotrophicus]